MRLGGPVFGKWETPGEWAEKVRSAGYAAAYSPACPDDDDQTVAAYAEAARKKDIVIAEVGAWSNPLAKDEKTRASALEKCKRSLDLADRIGAACCVNISGSRGEKWDGPCGEDLSEDAFEMIVASVREIIDDARPSRAFYTLETMPWMFPDSADSYLRLVKAVGRDRFAVHFDPVNLVNCPSRYFATGDLIKDFVRKLGPLIRSCHAKDIMMRGNLTLRMDEVRPGTGNLDYRVFLSEMERLSPDVPVMLEHLPSEEEYSAAAGHLRETARAQNITLK